MGHHLKPEEPLYETVAVLSYEVGRLLEMAMYLHWGEKSSEENIKRGLRAQAETEVMDVGAQFQLICESMGLDPEKMTKLGLEKAEERFSRKEYKHFNLREETSGD